MAQTRKVALSEATHEELAAAAKLLNLDVAGASSPAKLRALIKATHPFDEIDVPSDELAQPRVVGVQTKGIPADYHQPRKGYVRVDGKDYPVTPDGKVIVTISATDMNQRGHEEVQVNERVMLIPVGEPVAIPVHFFEALLHTVGKVAVVDTKTSEIRGWREVPQIPFSVQAPAFIDG